MATRGGANIGRDTTPFTPASATQAVAIAARRAHNAIHVASVPRRPRR
jgi:hypothetical protein